MHINVLSAAITIAIKILALRHDPPKGGIDKSYDKGRCKGADVGGQPLRLGLLQHDLDEPAPLNRCGRIRPDAESLPYASSSSHHILV
jgi:hypothetical protein